MTRYRLVTRHTAGGTTETHVSSVIQTFDEALDDIDAEEHIAGLAGWQTARLETLAGFAELVCTRGKTTRSLTIRESGPFDDAV